MRKSSFLGAILTLATCWFAASCATAPVYSKVAAASEEAHCPQSKCWARWVGKDSGDAFIPPSASEQKELHQSLSQCVTELAAASSRGVIYESLADRRLKSCMKAKSWVYWVQEVTI